MISDWAKSDLLFPNYLFCFCYAIIFSAFRFVFLFILWANLAIFDQSQTTIPKFGLLFSILSLILSKNPEYGRQSISRPMQIVAPMPCEGGQGIPKNPIFFLNGKNHPRRKNSKTSRTRQSSSVDDRPSPN